jgi:hypothetical protein
LAGGHRGGRLFKSGRVHVPTDRGLFGEIFNFSANS